MGLIWVVPLSSLLTIAFLVYLIRDVMGRDRGTEKMQEVGSAIYKGAVAFISRQYSTIAILAIVTSIIVAAIVGSFTQGSETGITGFALAWRTALSFLVGAAASAVSGIIGMYVSVQTNQRVASAAREGVEPALRVALNGGAVAGFIVVALSSLSVFTMFVLFGGLSDNGVKDAPFLIAGMGFGASFVALFAQLGGGIYTKAADVGADLVGKVEAGIPEDDPRNAGVVADLVGDNVGDCAGRGADLFESTVAENIGAMILGVGLYVATGREEWIIFPLVIRAFGLIASIIGVWAALNVPGIKLDPGESPMNPLYRGYALTAGLCIIALFAIVMIMLEDFWFFLAGLSGVLVSLAFVAITMYYTEHRFRPVKMIAKSSLRGSGPNIITGLAMGFENTALPAIAVAIGLLSSYWLGTQGAEALDLQRDWARMEDKIIAERAAGEEPELHEQLLVALDPDFVGGIYGTAVAAMGMLMTAGFVLAMDTFGPIVDNAGGIVEMSGAPEEIRQGTDALDAAGNTTKALTKGYAIGSAALAAFLLFSAYLDKVALVQFDKFKDDPEKLIENVKIVDGVHAVNMGQMEVFVGALLGAMLVYLFSSIAMRAVAEVAENVIEEVRRQFKEIPGLLAGDPNAKADYGKAVDITTQGALRAMVLPGMLAVGMPIVVGILLGAEATAGFLMSATVAGILLALVMNNGGGAWDNAKKYIESGEFTDENGVVHKKKSEAHKAAVVGDTVGDPFKDTAGPSLHVLIKLLATITLVLAPLFV
ncbi:MAG: K(+)-insensitive pyrophosphate-energized proton pump [Chloroflexota bacterium]|nr:sodium-translocating pyrophosphatase [Chloroflexota bacterium]NOG65369.1 sodium-translocating pyrophosphatase [Chloroflexota bacterium]GIK66756.1 MAG: K(+)-insensitive pyrophosphate-energized proton pump [Chloroflexota bacterium]